MNLIVLFIIVFSVPSFACVNLNGTYVSPAQEEDFLHLTRVRQDCNQILIYRDVIYLPTHHYLFDHNPSGFMLDGKKRCNVFGFCQVAKINDTEITITHDLRKLKKHNEQFCENEITTFQPSSSNSLDIVYKCNDGSSIIQNYQKHKSN